MATKKSTPAAQTTPARRQREDYDPTQMKILARAVVAKGEDGNWGQVKGVNVATPPEPGQRRTEVHVFQYKDNSPKAKVVIVGVSSKGETYTKNLESFELSLATVLGKLAEKAAALIASKGASKARKTAA